MGALVFVEGVPGSGKSTTAQFLARQLVSAGRPARWIYEEEAPNPFVPDVADDAYRDWAHWTELHVERWRAFARSAARAGETIVVESHLLQRPVFTTLRRDVDTSVIEAAVNRFADAVATLAPSLIYLSYDDPARAWRSIAAKRGPDFAAEVVRRSEEWPYVQSRGLAGLDGVLAYWQAHGALCDKMVSWIPMRTLMIDASRGEWASRRRQMCEFLGAPDAVPSAPDARALDHLAGTYKGAQRDLAVELIAGQLVLRGALWDTNPLLPVSPGLFDVEAWPFQARFTDDTLSLEGARLWWGGPVGVYRRDGRGR